MTDLAEELRDYAANNLNYSSGKSSAKLMNDAANKLDELRSWQIDACDELVNWGRYAMEMQPITALLERANEPLPEWWNIGA